jgi:hypothetical protein
MSKAKIEGRKIRLHYHLKITEDNKTILDTHKRIKSRIVADVEASPWKQGHTKGYIKVDYGNDGLINDGTYDNRASLLKALDSFTEKSLIEFAIND